MRLAMSPVVIHATIPAMSCAMIHAVSPAVVHAVIPAMSPAMIHAVSPAVIHAMSPAMSPAAIQAMSLAMSPAPRVPFAALPRAASCWESFHVAER